VQTLLVVGPRKNYKNNKRRASNKRVGPGKKC